MQLMNAAICSNCIGYPLPPFLSIKDDAEWWASLACLEERKIYVAEIIKTLTREQLVALICYSQRLAA